MLPNHLIGLSGGDLQRYLGGGFCSIKTPVDKSAMWTEIARISAAKEVFLSRGGRSCGKWPVAQLNINLAFPARGLYNYENQVMVVSRKPTRTTMKIVSPETIEVVPLFRTMASKARFILSTAALELLFKPYPVVDMQKIYPRLTQGRVLARVLDNNFAISIPLMSQTPQLWYFQSIIGHFPAPEVISLHSNEYLQEVMDTFPNHTVAL